MLFSVRTLLALTMLSVTISAVPEPYPTTTCPPVRSGTTTLTVNGPGKTSTQYAASAVVGDDVDCHGYSNLFLKTRGPKPTTTVTVTDTFVGGIPICAATFYPSGCPSSCPAIRKGTTTYSITASGGTSTRYAGTVYDGQFHECNGYTRITTTEVGPKPTKTVSLKGTVTQASYICSPTPVPPGC